MGTHGEGCALTQTEQQGRSEPLCDRNTDQHESGSPAFPSPESVFLVCLALCTRKSHPQTTLPSSLTQTLTITVIKNYPKVSRSRRQGPAFSRYVLLLLTLRPPPPPQPPQEGVCMCSSHWAAGGTLRRLQLIRVSCLQLKHVRH